MDILNLVKENKEIIITGSTFLVAWLLPNPKLKWLGQKAGEKIPKKVAKLIKEKLDAFEEGLITDSVNGNSNLISNEQLKENKKKLEIDLGLEPQLKEKALK